MMMEMDFGLALLKKETINSVWYKNELGAI